MKARIRKAKKPKQVSTLTPQEREANRVAQEARHRRIAISQLKDQLIKKEARDKEQEMLVRVFTERSLFNWANGRDKRKAQMYRKRGLTNEATQDAQDVDRFVCRQLEALFKRAGI